MVIITEDVRRAISKATDHLHDYMTAVKDNQWSDYDIPEWNAYRKAKIAVDRKLARANGWRVSKQNFSLLDLRYRKEARTFDAFVDSHPLWHRFLDHAVFFRQNRCPVAIVAHTYLPIDDISGVIAAAPPGLKMAILPCQSWYFPIKCTPVIVTRNEETE